jgi:hypothetical protein
MADQLTRWRWSAQRLAERAGPVGVAAGVLVLATLLAWALLARSIAAEVHALAADNESLQRRPAASRAASAPLTTEQQLLAFEGAFPDPQALGTSYSRLWNVARRHGVALKAAEFKLSDVPQDEFQRYTIQLPVTADYAALRAFVVDALADLPSLALEEMSLRREDSKSLQIEARLSFVLFVRRGSV